MTVVFYSTEFNRNPKPTFDACDQMSFWVYDVNDIPHMEERLMRTGAIHGLAFHCTPLVDTGLETVKMSKEWIRRHGEDLWGVDQPVLKRE